MMTDTLNKLYQTCEKYTFKGLDDYGVKDFKFVFDDDFVAGYAPSYQFTRNSQSSRAIPVGHEIPFNDSIITETNFSKLKKFLRTFTYKKDWTFRIEPMHGYPYGLNAAAVIYIRVGNVVDVLNQDAKPTFVNNTCFFDGSMSVDEFKRFLWNRIVETEMHEALEWFMVDGKYVSGYEPHEKGNPNSSRCAPGVEITSHRRKLNDGSLK